MLEYTRCWPFLPGWKLQLFVNFTNSVAHVSWYAGVRVSLGLHQKGEWLVRGWVVVNLEARSTAKFWELYFYERGRGVCSDASLLESSCGDKVVQTLGLGLLHNVEMQHQYYVLKILSGPSFVEPRAEKWGLTVSNDTTDQHPKLFVAYPQGNLFQAEIVVYVLLFCTSKKDI